MKFFLRFSATPAHLHIQSDFCSTQIFTELLISSRCCARDWEHIQGICDPMQRARPSTESSQVLVKILVARLPSNPESEIWGWSLRSVGLGVHTAHGSPLACVNRENFFPFLQIMMALPSGQWLLPGKEGQVHSGFQQMLPSLWPYTKTPRFWQRQTSH